MIRPLAVPDGIDVAIHELVGGNRDRLETMLALYAELMPEYARFIPRMRRRAGLPADHDPRFVQHLWLFEVGSQPAAMADFKCAPGRNCAIVLDSAIAPAFRSFTVGSYGRMGHFILACMEAQARHDAQLAGRSAPFGLVAEVGPDRLLKHYQDEYGYVKLPVEYQEPVLPPEFEPGIEPVSPEKLSFHPMHLGVFPVGTDFDPMDQAIVTNSVLVFLVDHYGLPEDHEVVRHALESFQSQQERS